MKYVKELKKESIKAKDNKTMQTNEELLKKDLAIIINLAVNILLKDELNQDDIVTSETLEKALQV